MTPSDLADRRAEESIAPPTLESPSSSKRFLILVGVVAAGVIGTIVILVLLGAIILGVRSTDSAAQSLPDRVDLARVGGAPEADLVLPVELHMLSGTDDDFVAVGADPLTDHVFPHHDALLVATVNTEIGPSHIYQYSVFHETEFGASEELSCYGVYGYMSTATCNEGDAIASETNMAWGESSEHGNSETVHYVAVEGLPAKTEWVVVTSRDGNQIASASVVGLAFLQWVAPTGELGEPWNVVALDADFTELWTGTM